MKTFIAVISIIKELLPLFKEIVGYFKSLPKKARERKLNDIINRRASLTRQLELAKERGDNEEIKRLALALHMLNNDGGEILRDKD